MRYLISVIDHQTGTATAVEMTEIDAFNRRLLAEDRLILAIGLASPAQSMVIDNRGGAGGIAQGPLIEGPEYVSGMWVIDADDPAHAHELALEASRCCNRRVEVRPVLQG